MSFKTDWKKHIHHIRKRETDICRYFLEKNIPFNSGIEFGSGDGYQTTILNKWCNKYVSSDLNFGRLDSSFRVQGVDYQKYDADNLPKEILCKKFDFIFSSNLLEHISSPKKFLLETREMLSDDGIAVHIVPGRGVKIMYILFFYLNLLDLIGDRFVGVFFGKKIFRGNLSSSENNINKKHIKKTSKFKKIITPQIHGNYHTHYEEFYSWGKENWTSLFTLNGYQVSFYSKGPFYSGYGFGFNILRNIFERLGFFSEHIFVLRKKKEYILNKDILNISIITPKEKGEYLTNTIIDGLISLKKEGRFFDFKINSGYHAPFDVSMFELHDNDFIEYSNLCDVVILCRLDNGQTNYDVLNKIKPKKLIFADGSEFRGDFRLDPKNQKDIIDFLYSGFGSIDSKMLYNADMYIRREKPYISGVTPFPYGIESRYLSNFSNDIKKDIDFVCIFGQDMYHPMRKYVVEILEEYCKKNNFVFHTQKTKGFSFEDTKNGGREEFYKILSRAKVGISVSGGGFDTARFWETLANNCILLTEKIDIYNTDSNRLKYSRIYQFSNLFDFKYQLEKIGDLLRTEYSQDDLLKEYYDIIKDHSSKNRVLEMLKIAKERGIIDKNF